MSSRTYLSIGDVLTLLREEFPDVTISKIRFLESQGLVNPERSPSGYRKFFEHDVERLRWVLRQQREHFLPLKVIRDRLADGDLDDTPQRGANGKLAEPASPASHAAASIGSADDEQPTKADEEAMARILADASRRAALMPEAAQVRRGLQIVGEGAASDVASPTDAPEPDKGADTPTAAAGRRDSAPAGKGGATPSSPPDANDAAPRAGKARPSAPPTPSEAPVRASATRTTSGPAAEAAATSGMATGASLTAQEVCAASGLSAEELEGLESYGLICSMRVAGLQTYDEEALAVANLAAAFRAFGIEPRHLRLYRNAVDREMGLIEQVIIPLLRQRNPESRQRAVEGADQLAALGQSMRASLLRQALRQHLGG
ncbi:MAG TPA: MerR family transcriptional regulator [Acidimicrobiales bacterium]|nr:MerR family transcriptional regulator [Acidimicrobiales bacterium]